MVAGFVASQRSLHRKVQPIVPRKNYKAMNKIFFIVILFTAFGFAAAAQEAPKKESIKPRQTITKGYYSIGDHASKLPGGVVLATTRTVKEPARKGYHSIAAKSRQEVVVDLPPNPNRPPKGYYSIDSSRNPGGKQE